MRKYPNQEDLNSSSCTERSIRIHYPDFYKYLIEHYNECKYWSEKLYWFYNNIKEFPKCPVCGSVTRFQNFRQGYRVFCSNICLGKSKDVKNSRKKTLQERYGVDNTMQIQEVKEKHKQTCIERYGVDNVFKCEKIKDKIRKTNREKYGVDYPMQSKNIKNKSKQTCIERYGVEYTGQIIDAIEKSKQTYKNHYIEQHPNFIDYNEDNIIHKCINCDCCKCIERKFTIPKYVYYLRSKLQTELCTKVNPIVGFSEFSNSKTFIELFVIELLNAYNIKYYTNNRKQIYPLELDIYIPDKNIAIECNGVYWHSDIYKDSKYHRDKFKKCQEKGIQLISIWEDQVVNNPEKIKSIILSKLGIYEKRIYARKCEIKEVSSKECNDFLDNYHLQGKTNSPIRLGLYYNNELVSIMNFGRGRKCLNSKAKYELYRYCCKAGIQVVGGASKLFKYFVKEYKPESIESFSSNDISNGDLYKQLGFNYASESQSYWYVDKDMNRYHRYKFTKYSLINEGFDPGKTEFEIMNDRGFYRIYDSGQTKWVKSFC